METAFLTTSFPFLVLVVLERLVVGNTEMCGLALETMLGTKSNTIFFASCHCYC